MTAGTTELIEILDFSASPPERLSRWWWSDERGLSCDSNSAVEIFNAEGITLPLFMSPELRQVYPRDGRIFFDALPNRYSSLVRAQAATVVDEQGGMPCSEIVGRSGFGDWVTSSRQ